MAQRSQVPKFGSWESQEDVPYTAYFEKAKKVRNAKTNPEVPEPSFNNGESTKSEPERAKDQDSSSRTKHEEVDLTKSTDSSANPRRTSRQSVGSDRSFDSSPMRPNHQPRAGNRGSEGGSTPVNSRLRQINHGDETPDDGPAIPKFGDWDDSDPRSGEGYTEVFNKAREDRHSGGGKSPMISTENANFYGQRNEKSKGCGCFPWSRK